MGVPTLATRGQKFGVPLFSKSLFQNILSDSFTRANTVTGGAGTSTGAGNGWLDVQGGAWLILGNSLKGIADAADNNQYARTFLLRPVSEAFLNGRIEATSGPTTAWAPSASKSFILRKQAGAATYLLGRVINDGSGLQIWKVIAGAPTLIQGGFTIPGFSTAKTYRFVFEAYDLSVSLIAYDITSGTPVAAGAVSSQGGGVPIGVTTAGVAGFTADWLASSVTVYDDVLISTKNVMKLSFAGDSILHLTPTGGGFSTAEAIALALSVRTGKDYTVTDNAVAGRTSAATLANIATDISANAASGATDVFLLTGANDSTSINAVSKAAYKANVAAYIAGIKVGSVQRVWLISCIYAEPNSQAGRDYTNETRLKTYIEAEQELADGVSVFFIGSKLFEMTRANGGTGMFEQADGVHPSVRGQYRIVTTLADECCDKF